MNYIVKIGSNAKRDINNINNYITYELNSPQSAQKLLNKIINIINTLDTSPEKYMVYPDEPLKSQSIRYFIVQKYFGFYTIDHSKKIVSIRRIIYSGRNIKNISI